MVGGQDVFSVDGQRIVVVGGTAGIGLGVAAHLVDKDVGGTGVTVLIAGYLRFHAGILPGLDSQVRKRIVAQP